MSKIIPFCGLRYDIDKIQDINSVVALPFETMTGLDEKQLFNKSAYNIGRVSSCFRKGKPYASTEAAVSLIDEWTREGIFTAEKEPALYIYEQVYTKGMVPHSVKGVIGLVEVENYGSKIIFPHEEITTTLNPNLLEFWKKAHINPSPIWSFYSDTDNLAENLIMKACEENPPDIEFADDRGILQRLWVVKDSSFIEGFCSVLSDKQLFIAEGHHKYETALAFRDEKVNGVSGDRGKYTMMTLTSMENNSLDILPYHRMVRSDIFDENTMINNLTADFAISKIYITDDNFAEVILTKLSSTLNDKSMGIYTGGNYYYYLRLNNDYSIDKIVRDKSDCFRQLDVTVLNSLVIKKQLSRVVAGRENVPEIEYTRFADEAIRRVRSEEFQCAFFLNPTTLPELREIALANERLPKFSSYFRPKILTGLVMDKMDV